MRPSEAIAAHRDEILAISAARGAGNVRVFGSTARGLDTDGSDLDLLVDVPAGISLYELAAIQLDLEKALGVPVDLRTEQELHPRIRPKVLAESRRL